MLAVRAAKGMKGLGCSCRPAAQNSWQRCLELEGAGRVPLMHV